MRTWLLRRPIGYSRPYLLLCSHHFTSVLPIAILAWSLVYMG